MPRHSNPKFEIDEVALCFYPPLYYHAEVMEHRITEDGSEHQYFIHYTGWHVEWNEWVSENQLLKVNEKSLQMQADAKKQNTARNDDVEPQPKKKRGRPSNVKTVEKEKSVDKFGMDVSRAPVKPGEPNVPIEFEQAASSNEEAVNHDETYEANAIDDVIEPMNPETPESNSPTPSPLPSPTCNSEAIDMQIKLPERLEYWLQKDCKLINGIDLHNLPAKVGVKLIIDAYVESKPPDDKAVLLDVMKTLENYFEEILDSSLLYDNERAQYEDMLQLNRPLSHVYGAFHLLRMFVHLNSDLPNLSLSSQSKIALLRCVSNFVEYLKENEEKYLRDDSFVIILS